MQDNPKTSDPSLLPRVERAAENGKSANTLGFNPSVRRVEAQAGPTFSLRGGGRVSFYNMKLTDFLRDVGRPIAYYPSLAKLIGVKECVLLCQLLYWSDKGSTGDGWIFKTMAEITDETGLSRTEQENARKGLRTAKLLEEKNRRVEHRLYFRIQTDQLNELWEKTLTDRGGNAGNLHSGMRETGLPESGKPTFAEAGNPHSFYRTENTTETTSKKAREFPLIPLLLDTPEFQAAWSDWLAYRKERRMPVTPTAAKLAFRQCEGWGPERGAEYIRHAITSNWQGLHEPSQRAVMSMSKVVGRPPMAPIMR